MLQISEIVKKTEEMFDLFNSCFCFLISVDGTVQTQRIYLSYIASCRSLLRMSELRQSKGT